VFWLTLLSLFGNSAPALADGEILLGLVPSEDPSALVTDNQAIIAALEASLGMKVKPFIATDYNGVIEALRAARPALAARPRAEVLAFHAALLEAVHADGPLDVVALSRARPSTPPAPRSETSAGSSRS
jgi:phosphonate transport system substrate-binding protein